MRSIEIAIKKYRTEGRGMRFGQWFCNNYIKSSMPKLYYCEDFDYCCELIREWLRSHHYYDTLPTKIEYVTPDEVDDK